METLAPFFSVIESAIKNSREARSALRAWLDEVDKKYPLPEAKPAVADLPTIYTVGPSREDREDRFHGVQPYFDAHPEDYRWTYIGGNQTSKVAHFERNLPKGGPVKLNYYYSTGSVQLIHNNPAWEGWGSQTPRRLQETFKSLSEKDFRNLLNNTASFFNKRID
jgi:hypothetical protein